MGKILHIEYFRVPPRWLFVKVTDDAGNAGWGEASLEGHTQAVEGCLDAWSDQYTGLEAEYVSLMKPVAVLSCHKTHVTWLSPMGVITLPSRFLDT